jgi:hypothetical protein
MVNFVEASIDDLVLSTEFIHHIRPELREKYVIGIEKAQPFDQNVIFHLATFGSKSDNEIFMLSADYIARHPFFKD